MSRRDWKPFNLGTRYVQNVHPANLGEDACITLLDWNVRDERGSHRARYGHENIVYGTGGFPAMPNGMASASHVDEIQLNDGTRRYVILGNTASRYGVIWLYDPDHGDVGWVELTSAAGTPLPQDISDSATSGRSLVCFNGQIRAYGDRMFWWGEITHVGTYAFIKDNVTMPLVPNRTGHNNDFDPKAYWPTGIGSTIFWELALTPVAADATGGYTGGPPYPVIHYAVSLVYEGGQESPLAFPLNGSYQIHATYSESTVDTGESKVAVVMTVNRESFRVFHAMRVKQVKLYSVQPAGRDALGGGHGVDTLNTKMTTAHWKLVKTIDIITNTQDAHDSLEWTDLGSQQVQISFTDTGLGLQSYASQTGIVAGYHRDITKQQGVYGHGITPVRRYASKPVSGRQLFGNVTADGTEWGSRFYYSHINRFGLMYDIVPPLNFNNMEAAGVWRGAATSRNFVQILGNTGYLVAQFAPSLTIHKADVPVGCIAIQSIAQTPEGPIWLGRDGLYQGQGLSHDGPFGHEFFDEIKNYPNLADAQGAYAARRETYYFWIPADDDLPLTYPFKLYALHLPTKEVWQLTPPSNQPILALSPDLRDGVIALTMYSNVGQIARLEHDKQYFDLQFPGTTYVPKPNARTGWRLLGANGEKHMPRAVSFRYQSPVPLYVIFFTLSPTQQSSSITVNAALTETEVNIAVPRTIAPAEFLGVQVFLNDVPTDPSAPMVTLSPVEYEPPRGPLNYDFYITRPELWVIPTEVTRR